jgi:predicted transcriptional regulator
MTEKEFEEIRDKDHVVLQKIEEGLDDVQKITEETTLENHHVSYSFEKLEQQGLITVEKPDQMVERVVDGQKRVFQHPKQAELMDKGLQYLEESESEDVTEYEGLSHDELVERVITVEEDLDELKEAFKLFKKQIQKKI